MKRPLSGDTLAVGVPGAPALGLSPVTGQAFRDCIARLPLGVNIVTTDGPAGRSGFTATAVASVSDEPPTVLVCLNRKSSQTAALKANARFAINLLPAGAQDLADIFAGRTGLSGPERLAHGDWTVLATGAPALVGAITTLDCELVECSEVGTHTVFFGRVVGSALIPPAGGGVRETLIYHDRHYAEA